MFGQNKREWEQKTGGGVKGERMSWSKRTKDGKRVREAKRCIFSPSQKIDPNRTATQ
jgi:hypothetical protein